MDRRRTSLLASLVGLTSLATGFDCAPQPGSDASQSASGASVTRTPATSPAESDVRISLARAEALVDAYVRKEKPQMNPSARFPLHEMTTDAVWDRLRLQVFRVTEGAAEFETFVIRQDRVYCIGIGFGGDGVNSFCVADLAHDDRPWLVYSFSCGSGIHRSMIGAFDALSQEPTNSILNMAYFNDSNLSVVTDGDSVVRVMQGQEHVGWVEVTGAGQSRRLRVRLEEGVPYKTSGFDGFVIFPEKEVRSP